MAMIDHAFSGPEPVPSAGAEPRTAPALERQEGAWRVLPLEGSLEIVYEDRSGAWSVRRLAPQELRIGPGKVLIGAVDRERDGYRGFRADRVHRLTDLATGERVERNLVDWLIARAERTLRERRREARREARRTAKAA